jgi:DNA polymerase I-like protein with 3'-5' exonuclease and polymerase domains/uracil-DNA glycosylase
MMTYRSSLECSDCRYNTEGRHTLVCGYPLATKVLFVANHPTSWAETIDPMSEKKVAFVKNIVNKCYTETTADKGVAYTYLCRCVPNYSDETHKFDVKSADLDRCAAGLKMKLRQNPPRVIVACGSEAAKAFGIVGAFKGIRGSIRKYENIPVVCTYHPFALSTAPGLIDAFTADIKKAFDIAYKGHVVSDEVQSEFFIEFDDVMNAIGKVKKFLDSCPHEQWPVAVDTETTSLEPYNPSDRVIAVSLSWKNNYGIAFPFEHSQHRYSDEQFKQLYDAVQAVLSHPKAKLVFANGKFDLQWLRHHYGMKVNSIYADIVLEEHLLDENKKGEYSLKSITKDRFPACGKYEEELNARMDEIYAQKVEETKKDDDEIAKLDFWLNQTESDQHSLLTSWLEEGSIELSDVAAMSHVKKVKRNGKMVIPKKYAAAAAKLIAKNQQQEAPKKKDFEAAPLDILLKYAGIDAAMTFKIACAQRNKDYKKEADKLSNLYNKLKALGAKGAAMLSRFDFKQVKPLDYTCKTLTLPLSEVLGHMEYCGVKLNREKAEGYQKILEDKLKEYGDRIFLREGKKFSLNSPKDLHNIIMDKYGATPKYTTDSGEPAFTAEALKEMAEDLEAKPERTDKEEALVGFLRDLLTYRRLEKTQQTYITNWLKMSELDGKIHCHFIQIGTATARLASNSPNLFGLVKLRELSEHPTRIAA